jgi:hypothetical protein
MSAGRRPMSAGMLTRIFGASSSSFHSWPFVGPRMGPMGCCCPCVRVGHLLDHEWAAEALLLSVLAICRTTYGSDGALLYCTGTGRPHLLVTTPCWNCWISTVYCTVRCSTVRVRYHYTISSQRYRYRYCHISSQRYRYCHIDLIGYYFLTINRLALQDFTTPLECTSRLLHCSTMLEMLCD